MNFVYAHYWLAHGTSFYTSATPGAMNKINTCIPYVLHSISHLLCAALALCSATSNREFNDCHTQKCTCRGGATMSNMRNFHVVWWANITISHKYPRTVLETCEPFHPGFTIWLLHQLISLLERKLWYSLECIKNIMWGWLEHLVKTSASCTSNIKLSTKNLHCFYTVVPLIATSDLQLPQTIKFCSPQKISIGCLYSVIFEARVLIIPKVTIFLRVLMSDIFADWPKNIQYYWARE